MRYPVPNNWHLDDQDRQAARIRGLARVGLHENGPVGLRTRHFLLLAQTEGEAPRLHYRFLDKRSPLPLHPSWADWLWRRGLQKEEITQLQSAGVVAYRCNPNPESLKEDLSQAVASGLLTLPGEEEPIVAAVNGGGYG